MKARDDLDRSAVNEIKTGAETGAGNLLGRQAVKDARRVGLVEFLARDLAPLPRSTGRSGKSTGRRSRSRRRS
jgi:hypothetical protein